MNVARVLSNPELWITIVSGIFTLAGMWLRARHPGREGVPATDPPADTAPPPTPDPSLPRRGPRRVPILLWLSALPYSVFTWMLLTGGKSMDEDAGLLFVGNTLFIMIGSVRAFLGMSRPDSVCLTVGGVQVVIMLVMLAQGIGDAEIVIPLNLAIAGGFGLLALVYRRRSLLSRGYPSNSSR
jgi:hypothetical protein